MIRSFFLALGVFVVILGLESLAVDQVVLRMERKVEASTIAERFSSKAPTEPVRFYVPDWIPWVLMSAGAVTVLYAVTIRSNKASE